MATQELQRSFKTGDGSNHSSGYGSAENDDIIIDKKSSSRCNSKCFLTWSPLIIAIAALILGIVAVIEVRDINKNDTSSAMMTSIGHISRNLILSQFAVEQRARSQGDSGLTNVRGHFDGDADYDEGTYSNGAAAAIHDHADFIHICGMGELQAVLNGVEFQTRHNDYRLNMPSTNSTEYGAVEPLPFPDVPPEVINAGDINDQIIEMQEWFRAFKTQNKSHRYYPDYFKPVLCYLEGTWIDDTDLKEPFDSDRHEIDAASWKELHDKIRYMSNSGRKDTLENLAHLPSSIRNLIDEKYPVISNWEYRILCAPLKNDIPLERFRVNDDLSVQLLMSPLTREELYYSRRARFDLSKYINLTDPDSDESYPFGYWQPGVKPWNYLDYLMEQVPGKDNYMADLVDELPDGTERVVHYLDSSEINSGFYNRFYALTGLDAMGSARHRRSYNDRYLFAAKTSQENVSPIGMDWIDEDGNTIRVESRWSYAIPLEIVYLTPMKNWNPLNIPYVPLEEFPLFTTSGSCGLSGGDPDPYPGWTDFAAYFIPTEFYESAAGESSPADTVRSNICVLDEDGEMHAVYPSGHWITFPKIGGDVGFVRQRFPIFPVHGAGTPSFKELKSLQAILLDDDYDDPSSGVPFFGDERDRIYGFDIAVWGGGHEHIMHIPGWKVNYFWYDDTSESYLNGSDYMMFADTTIANQHEHAIYSWRYRKDDNSPWIYVIDECAYGTESDHGEFMSNACDDGHTQLLRGFE